MFDYQQAEEDRARKRLIKKTQEKKLKQIRERIVKKKRGKKVIKIFFWLACTGIFMPIAVIALDVYWFCTLFSEKLAKLGYIRGTILGGLNLLLLPLIVVAFMMFYCTVNPIECGWEVAKETVKQIVD
ncbi:hypothetical protein K8R61_00590 [bacterium]|nr:hypothetical protein [bacterium]